MKLQAADVLAELDQLFPGIFGLNMETQRYFRLGTGEKGLIFQFHSLPRSPEEEISPAEMQQQRETFSQSSERIILVWEDQWRLRRPAVISRMAALLGSCRRIHGRETSLQRVDAGAALRFLEDNHLLVPLKGKYRFGLIYKNELRSLAVFSGPRRMKEKGEDHRSFELLRFCHSRMHLVTGGLSKLLKGFAEQFRPDDIMTYVDLDWSDGEAFVKNGFVPSGRTPSQAFWINPQEGKRYYPQYLPASQQGTAPERLHQAGYYRIYNSGSLKLIRSYEWFE